MSKKEEYIKSINKIKASNKMKENILNTVGMDRCVHPTHNKDNWRTVQEKRKQSLGYRLRSSSNSCSYNRLCIYPIRNIFNRR
ncbi:MAG: hypothetical protein FWC68_03390 [Oscillospiraceae bacterium]|nr:hypothetical protein [Oscillospiraceae bacterium]